MATKILIADDETEVLDLIRLWLEKANFEVVAAQNGAEAVRRFYHNRPHLVLLDVNMPIMDGWEACRRIRDMSDVPIIMITVNGTKDDILRGFNLGVDDYILKPVDLRELVARMRAVLRRADDIREDEEPTTINEGEIEVDWKSHQVYVRGERINLSPTEFKLLACLIKNRGWVVPHEQLLEKAWGPNYIGDRSFVKLYIRYLRQKIEKNPGKPLFILTERGIGYRFAVPSTEMGIKGREREKAVIFS